MNLFAKKIPIWNGNLKKLPKKGRRFFYLTSVYYWQPCLCGCGKPTVYTENGDRDKSMTEFFRNSKKVNAWDIAKTLTGMDEIAYAQTAGRRAGYLVFSLCLKLFTSDKAIKDYPNHLICRMDVLDAMEEIYAEAEEFIPKKNIS